MDNLPPKYFLAYKGISFFINNDRVEGITATSPRWKLPDGLRVRASEKGVKKALGADFERKEFPAKDFLVYLSSDCQPTSLVVIEQDTFLSKLLIEDLIFGSKVLDHFLLLTVDPTGEDEETQLPWLEKESHD